MDRHSHQEESSAHFPKGLIDKELNGDSVINAGFRTRYKGLTGFHENDTVPAIRTDTSRRDSGLVSGLTERDTSDARIPDSSTFLISLDYRGSIAYFRFDRKKPLI